MSPRRVHVVVPEGVDDPARVSGGNVYDLRVCDELARLGWEVRLTPVTTDASASALASLADDELVLLDGLIAGRAVGAVEAETARLRIVVLAHMASDAFDDADPSVVDGERRAFSAAARVVATSAWTRDRIRAAGAVPRERLAIAVPGAADAAPAEGSPDGASLLSVGVIAAHKGHDVLIEALAGLDRGRPWRCTIAGSTAVDPEFARRLADRAAAVGLADRVRFAGVLGGAALDDAYRHADLVVVPSRVEGYGIVAADALRRGIPVVASDAGGLREALAGTEGALLVPPGDSEALHGALSRWMSDPALRARLAAAARRDRDRPPTWTDTAEALAAVLEEVA